MARFSIAFTLALTLAAGLHAQDAGPAAFIQHVEQTLNDLSIRASRAGWVQSTYITPDTELIAAQANESSIAATTEFAMQAAKYRGAPQLSPELERKINLLRLSLTMPAPQNAAELGE